MAALILPSRWTQQPQGAIELDPSHWAAHAINHCTSFGSAVHDIAGRGAMTVAGAPPAVATSAGVAARFAGATDAYSYPHVAALDNPSKIIIVAVAAVDAGATSSMIVARNYASFALPYALIGRFPAIASEFGFGFYNGSWRLSGGSDVRGTGMRRMVGSYDGTTLRSHLDGKLDGSNAYTGALVTNTTALTVGRYLNDNIPANGNIALAYTINGDIFPITEAACRELSSNPWQVFRPQVRRIYFDLGAGGGVTNMTLTASASGSASFARAVQAIKSASATSAAVTERLIAIQRSASGIGTASQSNSKSVLRTVTASASGSASASRVVSMARSVSSTATATYSRVVGLLRAVTGAGTATLTGPATTQFLRPDGNVTQTSFTGGFAEIDEVTASDADFAYGTNNTAATLEVSLSNPAETPGSGTTTVRYRVAKTNAGVLDGGGNSCTVTASVYQGVTLISADAARTVTGTWTDYSWTPSMASVTDWNDLRLRFVTSASGGTAASRRGGAVSWAEAEVPAAGAVTFNQALSATSTAAASFVRSVGRIASASASGAASAVRSIGKSASAAASGAAAFVRSIAFVRAVTSTASATLTASRALFATLAASSSGTAALAAVSAISMTLAAAATGSALMVASVGLLITAAAVGTASASRVIGLTRAAASSATATIQRGITMALGAVASVAAALTKLASTAGTSLARMLSIGAENRAHTPAAENRIRTLGAEDRDLTE